MKKKGIVIAILIVAIIAVIAVFVVNIYNSLVPLEQAGAIAVGTGTERLSATGRPHSQSGGNGQRGGRI